MHAAGPHALCRPGVLLVFEALRGDRAGAAYGGGLFGERGGVLASGVDAREEDVGVGVADAGRLVHPVEVLHDGTPSRNAFASRRNWSAFHTGQAGLRCPCSAESSSITSAATSRRSGRVSSAIVVDPQVSQRATEIRRGTGQLA